jgi:hypothetical protein
VAWTTQPRAVKALARSVDHLSSFTLNPLAAISPPQVLISIALDWHVAIRRLA